MSEIDPKLVNQKLLEAIREIDDVQKYGNSEEPPSEHPFTEYLRAQLRRPSLSSMIFQVTPLNSQRDANEWDR